MENIYLHSHTISHKNRCDLLNQGPISIFFTGLSGSGKSTLANLVEKELYNAKYNTYLLDGDNIRTGLNSNLGFDEDSRKENIRRIAETSKLMNDAGLIVLSAFIAPFKEDRDKARNIIGKNFIEIHVDADLKTCEERDPKGLYKKARKGKIPNFTGIDSPYEKPENPEIYVNTSTMNIEDCVKHITHYINIFIQENYGF